MKHFYRAIWPKRLIICQSTRPKRDYITADEVSFFLLQGWHLHYGRYSARYAIRDDCIECSSKVHSHDWRVSRSRKKELFLQRYYEAYGREYRC